MKLIVGLGNPEEKYNNTRHNIGFEIVDNLLKTLFLGSTTQNKFKSQIFTFSKDKIIVAKPQTYMNNSGEAVSAITRFYKINPKNILIIHDDLDIPIGKIKLQYKKSPKDHKGILSIEKHLGTKNFYRLRIGVENRKDIRIAGEDYVLQRFTKNEQETINSLQSVINKYIIGFIQD